MIKNVSTNPSLYQRVLKLDHNENFSWDNIFDSSSIYKILYSLQIVESLLEQIKISKDLENMSEDEMLKKDWI